MCVVNPDKRYEKANRLFYNNQFKDALDILMEIVEDVPEHALALNKIGVIYIHAGQRQQAEVYFRQALDADPDCGAALGNLGSLLLADGEDKQAETMLEQAAKLDPENAYVLNNLAALYKNRGDTEKYLSLYKKSQRLLRDKLKQDTRADFHSMRGRSGCAGPAALTVFLLVVLVALWLA